MLNCANQYHWAKLLSLAVDNERVIFQDDQNGAELRFTSEQILQGDLNNYLTSPNTEVSEAEQPTSVGYSAPSKQERLIQIQQFVQVVKENFPQAKHLLNRLLELEEERKQIIENLDSNLHIKPRNTSRRDYPARSIKLNFSGTTRGFSWRTVVIIAVAMLICITAATAVYIIWSDFFII